jgi:CheY-like chemotaxis protein
MRHKKSILLVGNNDQELSILRYLLETRSFYRVISASEPLEAIDLFVGTPLHLVIADLFMAKMSGEELTRKLKQINPFVQIMLRGDPLRALRMSHEADALVSKKTAPGDLLERIRIMTARKRGPKRSMRLQAPHVPSCLAAQGAGSVSP